MSAAPFPVAPADPGPPCPGRATRAARAVLSALRRALGRLALSAVILVLLYVVAARLGYVAAAGGLYEQVAQITSEVGDIAEQALERLGAIRK